MNSKETLVWEIMRNEMYKYEHNSLCALEEDRRVLPAATSAFRSALSRAVKNKFYLKIVARKPKPGTKINECKSTSSK